MDRRHFLKSTLSATGGVAAFSGLSTLLPNIANAASSDYRALVCIFLYGGNDGMNMLVPTDTTRYDTYAQTRSKLAIPKNQLIAVGNTGFGLHPALSGLSTALTDQKLAGLVNVGPLVQPLTRNDLINRLKPLPDNLFSHSHQQQLWQCGGDSFEETEGWGGLMAEKNSSTVLSVAGNSRFGVTRLQGNLALPGAPGAFSLSGWFGNAPSLARKQALAKLSASSTNANRVVQQLNGIRNVAFARSDVLSPILLASPSTSSEAVNAAFSSYWNGKQFSSALIGQLYQIAKLITHRSEVGGGRHIYFAALGGFDTHANQVDGDDSTKGVHANLLRQVGDGLGAFYSAMKTLGLGQQVTAFTASDFGRTLKPNDSLGSDHAWGNHQLIVGGSVKSGIYGTYPDLTLAGASDAGNEGRWIPTTSVDQYAATFGSWLGLSPTDLAGVLPNLSHFTQKNLGFLV